VSGDDLVLSFGIYGGAEWLDINNGNGNNDLDLDGAFSTEVLNPDGFTGVTFAQVSVPEPPFASVLVILGLLFCRHPAGSKTSGRIEHDPE
jgi:hypothetical protein